MSEFYVLCSNPECDFSSRDKNFQVNGCPVCGADVLKGCPYCKRGFMFKNETFCHYCKERIKPEPAPKEKPEKAPKK